MNEKILIIDDEGDNCRLLTQWLIPLGYDIEVAANGEEAVRKAGNRTPDLIIINGIMPVTDSCRARSILKTDPRTRKIPIVRVSCQQDRKSDGYADGDDDRCKPAARQREPRPLWLDFDNSRKYQ